MNDEGIYLLENVTLDFKLHGRQEWTMKRDVIEVKTIYEVRTINVIEQISQEKLGLEVNDHGEQKKLVSIIESKDFAPQELKSLVELSGCFRFLGFFKHLSLKPLQRNMRNNIVLMQKSKQREFEC